MNGINIWIAIGAGGGLGAMARHGVSRVTLHYLGPNFPWGTLSVNVLGSFIMGAAIVWLSRHEPQSTALRGFLMVGVLGAFTTFSTFSMDVVTLYKDRTIQIAAAYLVASVVLSILGLLAGLFLTRQAL
ncbi:MAG: putative fluoride ion transporter CrcB [Hyphococcus sp.]|nr:MAG: putative fluoride ion transporter CrcB [Marinicaulis sp.]